jgi:hypothetical protein
VIVHSIVTSPAGDSGEYKVRGQAAAERDPTTQGAFAQVVREELGWSPEVGRFHLFRVEVEEVTFIRWENESGDQFVTRWPSHVEFVRRGTSATSVGRQNPSRISSFEAVGQMPRMRDRTCRTTAHDNGWWTSTIPNAQDQAGCKSHTEAHQGVEPSRPTSLHRVPEEVGVRLTVAIDAVGGVLRQ